MSPPVTSVVSTTTVNAWWMSFWATEYLPGRRVGVARRSVAPATSSASAKSARPSHIAPHVPRTSTRTTWNTTAAASTSPVIQCMVTQPNSTPTIGRNAVPSSDQHARGRDPVEQAVRQRVPDDAVGSRRAADTGA